MTSSFNRSLENHPCFWANIIFTWGTATKPHFVCTVAHPAKPLRLTPPDNTSSVSCFGEWIRPVQRKRGPINQRRCLMEVGPKRTTIARIAAGLGTLCGAIAPLSAMTRSQFGFAPYGCGVGGMLLLLVALYVLVDAMVVREVSSYRRPQTLTTQATVETLVPTCTHT